jgi:LmbE family N-acetylglucosaminyl deacetylase/glycosyltransferase involved in cell wall biosynthesis
MRAHRILVFAPHPDDEVLGCGGTLALARANGTKVKVIVITDGEEGIPDDLPPQVRRKECIAGLEILGVEDIVFWGYPNSSVPLSGPIIEKYREVVSEFMPQSIFLPSASEAHPDHRRATRGIIKALEGRWNGRLLFYETTQPGLINTTNDITAVMELKRLSALCHASQMKQFNYENLLLYMAHLRGLSMGREFAEGFLSYHWDGSRQNFFETRPLISVIVRADNLLYLRNALQSLSEQKYDQIEVVLVWHGKENIDLKEFDYLDIHSLVGEELRGRNLNLGLSHSKGEYIAFLDQDDMLYPDHFELLVSQLYGNKEYDITYSGCRALHCEMREGKPFILREEAIFNRPYQHGRLLLGNFIPIHALLFRGTVFQCHNFDEELPAYEDWELLAGLEMAGFSFLHIDKITCEYHLFDNKDFTIAQIHENKGYLDHNELILSKISKNLRHTDLRHLSELVLTDESRIDELEELVDGFKKQLARNQEELNQCQSIERLLSQGIAAANISRQGYEGVAAMIGRLISEEALFSIILPVYNTQAAVLEEALRSVRNQFFTNWELCLVDDASDKEETVRLLSVIRDSDFFQGKFRYLRHDNREGIVATLNDAVSLAATPFLVFLDHDDLLHEEALVTLALVIKSEKIYSLLYTDSRTIDVTGKPIHVYHKPDWSPENLLHGNYINHLTVVHRDTFNKIGRFRREYEGAQDLDLLLRLSVILKDDNVRHINIPLYDWRATADSVAYSSSNKPGIFESAQTAIVDHLNEKKLQDICVKPNPDGIGFACSWKQDNEEINIIIPTKDNLSGLRNCIEGLFQATDYPSFSVTIVSNNSSSPEMSAYLDTLRKKDHIHIIIDNRPFNWAALNNNAVSESSAPLLLFLNDDVEVKDRKWLMNMGKYLLLDGVGAVGATLFSPDGTLQHNGILTDEKFVAANITTWGKKNELTATRNVSAVTGACLLIERNTFKLVNGFNEDFPRSYNDVDFCLNIRNIGLRIVQPADVRLIHHESETCGLLDTAEKKHEWERSSALMRNKWGKQLAERYLPSYEIFAQMTKIVHVS